MTTPLQLERVVDAALPGGQGGAALPAAERLLLHLGPRQPQHLQRGALLLQRPRPRGHAAQVPRGPEVGALPAAPHPQTPRQWRGRAVVSLSAHVRCPHLLLPPGIVRNKLRRPNPS